MAAITLKQIEAFVAVADLGTFRRAAERLNTTQPNISNRIAGLEAQLRVSLMQRDAGSVRLTQKGQAILARARAVLAERDNLLAEAGEGALFEGVMRLGVTEMVAHTWLRSFLARMRQSFPSVNVELTVDLSSNLSHGLFDRQLDLTFQNYPFDRRAARTEHLATAPYVWVASKALGLHGRSLSPQDLAAYPILAHARASVPFRQIDQHLGETGVPMRLTTSSNITLCLELATDGLGVACLPLALVKPHLASGRLETLDYGWVPDALRFAARTLLDPAPHYVSAAIEIAVSLTEDNDFQSNTSDQKIFDDAFGPLPCDDSFGEV